MDSLKAKSLANELNELACKGCTEGWLEKHDGLSDPIQDINECGSLGFITPERQERLINEVKEINAKKLNNMDKKKEIARVSFLFLLSLQMMRYGLKFLKF